MAANHARGLWKYSSAYYRRRMLADPAHALVLTVPAAIGMLTFDFASALIGLLIAELIVLFCLPHLAWTRRAVEARIEGRARGVASRARAELLERMSDEHRRELCDLEGLAMAVRERCGGADEQAADALGTERLIELYIRLAIAHRAAATSLELVGLAAPDEAILDVERHLQTAADVVRPSIEHRLAILRLRREARRSAYERQSAINHDLAAIGDTLRWMQEQCASACDPMLRAELDVTLSAQASDAATIHELCALHDDGFDPDTILLGREASDLNPPSRTRVASRSEGQEEDGTGLELAASYVLAAKRL